MKLISKWVFTLAVFLLTVGCDMSEPQEQGSTSFSQTKESATPKAGQTTEAGESDQNDADQDDHRAADADVLHVRAVQARDGLWTFHVTVSHPDTGWEDYVDGWDVITDHGEILKNSSDDAFTRLLLHPHEDEQPFTRNQGRIIVPDGAIRLTVRAHDIVDGFGGIEVVVDLSVESGLNFVVERE